METKILKSEKLLENTNFLNNQNYIISNSSKGYIFSKFLFFKYLSIFSNRFVGTMIFVLLFNLFLAIFNLFAYFYGYIIVMLLMFINFSPFILFIFVIFRIINKKGNKKFLVKTNDLFGNNNKIKFNFLEFSNPIYNLKTFFVLDESNNYYKVNLFSMIFRGLLYSFFVLVVSIIFLIIIFGLMSYIIKLGYLKLTLNSNLLIYIFIFIFSSFLYLFKSLYYNFIKFRFINIILTPIFLLIFLPIFIYNKFVKSKNYNVFLLKPFNFRFEGFSYIGLKEAYNEYYKVILKIKMQTKIQKSQELIEN